MSLQSGEIGRLNCGRCPNASCTVASSACRPRNGAVPCSSSKAIMANANWSTFAVYGSCAAKQGKNPEPGEGFREGGSDRRRRRRGLRSSGFHGAGSIPLPCGTLLARCRATSRRLCATPGARRGAAVSAGEGLTGCRGARCGGAQQERQLLTPSAPPHGPAVRHAAATRGAERAEGRSGTGSDVGGTKVLGGGSPGGKWEQAGAVPASRSWTAQSR